MRSAAIADGLVYLDASALVKLVIEEPESAALSAFLNSRMTRASSELALAEAPRAVRRAAAGDPAAEGEALVADVNSVLASLVLMRLGRDVLVAAGAIEAPLLRALDAIHVASALAIGDSLSAFVSYDRRQLDAVRAAGITTASPGL